MTGSWLWLRPSEPANKGTAAGEPGLRGRAQRSWTWEPGAGREVGGPTAFSLSRVRSLPADTHAGLCLWGQDESSLPPALPTGTVLELVKFHLAVGEPAELGGRRTSENNTLFPG